MRFEAAFAGGTTYEVRDRRPPNEVVARCDSHAKASLVASALSVFLSLNGTASLALLEDCADMLEEHYEDASAEGDPPRYNPSPAMSMRTRIRDFLRSL